MLRATQTKRAGQQCGTPSRESSVWPQGLAPHWADKGMVVVVSRGEMDALLKNLTAVWALI